MISVNPSYLPKTPSPNTSTLGIRVSTEFWRGHKHSVHSKVEVDEGVT